MECTLCKTQNVGKTKTFNISVNNHRSDKIDRNVFPEYCHFAKDGHNFDIHGRFTLMEIMKERSKPLEIMEECFNGLKLLRLQPQGLNHRLSL